MKVGHSPHSVRHLSVLGVRFHYFLSNNLAGVLMSSPRAREHEPTGRQLSQSPRPCSARERVTMMTMTLQMRLSPHARLVVAAREAAERQLLGEEVCTILYLN